MQREHSNKRCDFDTQVDTRAVQMCSMGVRCRQATAMPCAELKEPGLLLLVSYMPLAVCPIFCGPGAHGDSSAVARTAAGTAEGVTELLTQPLAKLSKNRAITRARTAVGARFTQIASVADQNYAAEQHPLAPRNEQQRRAAQARR